MTVAAGPVLHRNARRLRVGIGCWRLRRVLLTMALALGTGAPAGAVLGTNDVVPAATLLLPYFEVDVADSDGRTTLLTVRNTGPAAAIAHAVVWTDLGVPTVTFDILLTGFQTRRIDLRQLFAEGSVGFPAFGGECESLVETGVVGQFQAELRDAHMGLASGFFEGACGAVPYGDQVARGYITIDNANDCSLTTPIDDGYFVEGGLGIASDDNVLWGEYALVDGGSGRAAGEPMVHIEASDAQETPFGFRTFYNRFAGAADDREPLAQSWGVRYFNQLTDVICWRDNAIRQTFGCDSFPQANLQGVNFPSTEPVIVTVYDHASSQTTSDDSAVPCDAVAKRTTVGGADFPVEPKSGWIYVDTDEDRPAQPQGFIISRQGYLAAVHRNLGGRSRLTGGVELDPFLPIAEQLTWPGAGGGGAP
jgi:hypothetical protein